MADRILVWYLGDKVGSGTSLGPTYRLDADYTVERVTVMSSRASRGVVRIDINADGVSIFDSGMRPTLVKGNTDETQVGGFALGELDEGTLLTLDIDEAGEIEAGARLTIQLDLDRST